MKLFAMSLLSVAAGVDLAPRVTLVGRSMEMAVSWGSLLNSTAWIHPAAVVSRVRWGITPSNLTHEVMANTSLMHSRTEDMSRYDYCGGKETHRLNMAVLSGLPLGTVIYYTVEESGADGHTETSRVHEFMTSTDTETSLRFLAMGDVGDPVTKDYTAFPEMTKLCSAEPDIALGLHVGDISYNLDIPPIGDNFLKEGVSKMSIPWMMAPGNHESDCNYTYQNYNGRFAAQNLTYASVNSGVARWYSFEYGPVHFVAIDTDAYGFDEVAPLLKPQYEWLVSDLEGVDKSKTPWTILYGHRPMYCSAASAQNSPRLGWPKQPDGVELPEPAEYGDGFRAVGVHPPPWSGPVGDAYPCGCGDALRNGVVSTEDDSTRLYALEPLMAKHDIQVYLTGHEHNYERLFPILNGTFTKSYDKPGKPVHVLTGSGGAYSKDPFGPEAPWDAARSSEWSYSDITLNWTHFTLKQKLNTNSTVVDEFTLVRA